MIHSLCKALHYLKSMVFNPVCKASHDAIGEEKKYSSTNVTQCYSFTSICDKNFVFYCTFSECLLCSSLILLGNRVVNKTDKVLLSLYVVFSHLSVLFHFYCPVLGPFFDLFCRVSHLLNCSLQISSLSPPVESMCYSIIFRKVHLVMLLAWSKAFLDSLWSAEEWTYPDPLTHRWFPFRVFQLSFCYWHLV